jgi:cell division topological specificity factor
MSRGGWSLGDLLSRVFARDEGSSKAVAKDRLRLVLIHDRADMAPEMLEALKNDMLRVISEYMDIDSEGFKVDFERHEDAMALVANIPIRSVKRHGVTT